MKNVTPPEWQVPQVDLKWVPRVIVGIVLLWGLLSCYITIPADSEGVVTRFGKYHDTLRPGLRFRLPFGIDRVYVEAVERQLKQEFGFGTYGTYERQRGSDPDGEASMVTGDLNMATVEWVVQFRIEDPKAWTFNVRDPDGTLRATAESVMREVVGDRTVDEVLTVGRQEIEDLNLQRLRELSIRYGLGVSIMQVQLKNVNPPVPVQSSFNEVNQAQQEREQQINVANGEYNRSVPRARGQAAQRISEAEGYATQRVNEAKGDAEKFTALLQEYSKAPEVTRQRLYFETMQEILPQLDRKIVLDEKATGVLPLLNLDSNPIAK